MVGVFNQSPFNSHTNAFRDIIIDEEAYNDQREFLRTTNKPRDMKVKDWVMRMKVINAYLEFLWQPDESSRRSNLLILSSLQTSPKSGRKTLSWDEDTTVPPSETPW